MHRSCNGQDRTAYFSEGDAVTYEAAWGDRKQTWSCSSCTGFKTGGGGGGGDSWGGGKGGGGKWGGGGGKW